MKSDLDYWIALDRQKERVLKRIKRAIGKKTKEKEVKHGRNDRRWPKSRQDK